jgi:hypothetical protein
MKGRDVMTGVPVRAVETTGVIDEERHLRLDTPLPVVTSGRVRVIVLFPGEEPGEMHESEWLYTATVNPAFDFLNDPQEDIYTLTDGKPFDDEG